MQDIQFETLAAAWQATFPGDSHLLQTLRAHLVSADAQLRRDQDSLHTLESTFAATGCPIHLWPLQAHHYLDLARRRHGRSQINFNRALATLQSSLPKPAKPAEPERKPIPMVAPESSRGRLLQNVGVSVEDGVTLTTTDQPASFWIEKNMWNDCIGFIRQFEFFDTIVPPEYAYVLTHNGEPQPPTRFVNITYSPEEFEKICHLEVASGSPHLLDGPRDRFQLLH